MENDPWERSLEEQIQTTVEHVYNLHRDQHYRGNYISNTEHLDGDEMPLGMTVTYGGSSMIEFVDVPLAEWHRDKAIDLLDEGYEALMEFSTGKELRGRQLETLADGSGKPTAYAWFHKEGQGRQPIIDDLGMGELFYFFKTEGDANRFMKEYVENYGITDLSPFERIEVELTEAVPGEELEDEILTREILREIESQDEEREGEPDQADIEKF